ncbi:FecR family protein [Aestuariibaculum lutulentum]|uniref:FecR domain-containing protein n=1 Tax=Aestuariibaculum lutulentum TaxID=2920935 RepID=A0ABS9RET1_9FLAO|nr:FecR family protein [Aestuariibaculum lutulentum]MCH4551459.1 FecR domain-containing protein [Aestuariibaculum lutulentum]
MDEINKQFEYSELLAGKVLDSLTDEQKEVLYEWEQQDENKGIAEDILNAYTFDEWQEKLKSIDTTEEWASFLDRMEIASEKPGKVLRLKAIKWMSAVAAVLVVGFSVFTFTDSNNDRLKPIAASSIAPGTSHAELVLSTGEVIDLEQSKDNQIQEGEVALENVKGILQYKDAKSRRRGDNKVKTNTLKVPRGAEYQLVLSDGTKVWLNSDTELTYTVPFVGTERRVALKGEAYFDVTPNKELPFIVMTGNQEVQVLGTEFNVSAYRDDSVITTTLVEGKVEVTDNISRDKKYLLPNQQSILNKQTDAIKKQEVDAYPYIAWKEGRFVFNNVTLEEFLYKVSRWYDVEVYYDNDSLKNLSFTGDLPRYSNMTSILKIIEAEMSVNIKVEDNKKIYVFR